nr:MAG TPA: Protein of unknown function (DUF3158) [Caudoviricetes sp.]
MGACFLRWRVVEYCQISSDNTIKGETPHDC